MDGEPHAARSSGGEDRVRFTRTSRIWLRDDGIIHVVELPGVIHDLADAEANIAMMEQIVGPTPCPILVDMRGSKGMDRSARLYYAGPAPTRVTACVALLVGTPLTRMIAGFSMAIMAKPLRPIQMFGSEQAAVTWLRKQPR